MSDYRRVFDRRGQDVAFAGLSGQRALERGIIALCAATGENDFFQIGPNQRRDFFARLLNPLGHLVTKAIRAGRIAPEITQERKHGLDHFRRDARRGVIIEIKCFPFAHFGGKGPFS
jgi:hypothetical protein